MSHRPLRGSDRVLETAEVETTASSDGANGVQPATIAGMHRAGTSMVAKALRLGGLNLGPDSELVPPAPDNPEGFFEHAGFVRLDEDLLAATGGAWDHVPSAPPMAADDPRVAGLSERALELVEQLAVVPSWGWKDPRTSLTLRFWLDLVPELRVVICVRHPLEVAMSLKRRNGTSYAHALSLWHAYYRALLEAVTESQRLVTHYDAHFRDPRAEVARILGFLGLPETASEDAERAAEPRLRHHQLDVTLAEAGVDPSTIALYEQLREEAGDPVGDAEGVDPGHAPARIDRNALDLALARRQLERRARQVESLEGQREELRGRVRELEEAEAGEALGGLEARIAGVEEGIFELRYSLEDLSGRDDADSLRACRSLVRAEVPTSAEVMVVAKGDPAWLDLYGRPAANFPQDESGRYPGFSFQRSLAAVAHLEARRARGSAFLLVPEPASWWRDHFPELIGHLTARYRVVADEPGVGLLVDLRELDATAQTGTPPLAQLLDRLAGSAAHEPAALDWTGLGMADHAPARNWFTPPPGAELPYLDRSVEVVLVGDGEGETQRLEEARRVASQAVVTVRAEPHPKVVGIETVAAASAEPTPGLVRFAAAAPDPDPAWLALLEEALAAEEDAEVVIDPDSLGELAEDGAELVAIVEPGVLPLPGCCDALRATLRQSDGAGAVAVKLLAADGAIEAAGTTVFADGSSAGVAAGTHKVDAPWHEYVRETCGGAGLLGFAADTFAALPGGGRSVSVGPPTSWAAAVWATGSRVVYQPDAAAVRALGDAEQSAAAAARVAEAWGPALSARPPRPSPLEGAQWRALLPSDSPAAGWR